MKVLVFSDTHLSDKFDEKKYEYLSSIIRQADKVIINGDFWEGFETTFDAFINSPWKDLFPLLKSKKAVYLYGNHDKATFSDKRVNFFSVEQGLQHRFKSGDKIFVCEHGNRLAPLVDELTHIDRPGRYSTMFWNHVQRQMVRRLNKYMLHLAFGRFNRQIKEKLKLELKKNEVYVCGHTHCAEIDLENQLVNSGLNHFGLGQCVWIVDGQVTPYEVWYS